MNFALIMALLGFMIYHGIMEDVLIDPLGNNWLQTEKIPLTLLEPYLERGHTVYLDNYYTTPRLAKYLLDHNTKLVGTVRPNRKGMPPGIEGKDLEKGKAAFYVSGNLMAIKSRASKDSSKGKPKTMCLLSTAMLLR